MKYLLLPLILLMMYSCSTTKVSQEYDKETDFTSFKSFSFYPWDKHNDSVMSSFDKQIILSSIKLQMEKRGYKEMEKGGDLTVSTFVIFEEKTMNQAYTNHYGGFAGNNSGYDYYGSSWAYGYGGQAYTTVPVSGRDFVQGTMIIDIFRLADKKLVWQGIGTKEVQNESKKTEKNISKIVGYMFQKFPTK